MAADDSDLLPKPPPPRPAPRDAAVEAALRRFDGEPAAAPERRTSRPISWIRQPQLGLALAASLVVVIGIPAAMIVLRDQGSSPVGVSAPPEPSLPRQAVPRTQGAVDSQTSAQPQPIDELARAPSAAPAVRAEDKEGAVARYANDLPAAPPAAEMAAAASPPPPPPPPPAPPPTFAQKSAEGASATSDLVVTGSRIRPNVSAEVANREQKSAARAESDAALAVPDSVLEDRSYATFLTALQAAVRANDRGAVIRLVDFPLRVNSGRTSRLYRDARSVRADYDRIFTPKVTRAILDQPVDRLFGRDQGVMIGNGEVWFDHVCSNRSCSPPGRVRIIAVNR